MMRHSYTSVQHVKYYMKKFFGRMLFIEIDTTQYSFIFNLNRDLISCTHNICSKPAYIELILFLLLWAMANFDTFNFCVYLNRTDIGLCNLD